MADYRPLSVVLIHVRTCILAEKTLPSRPRLRCLSNAGLAQNRVRLGDGMSFRPANRGAGIVSGMRPDLIGIQGPFPSIRRNDWRRPDKGADFAGYLNSSYCDVAGAISP
jgi:hypothetical protein